VKTKTGLAARGNASGQRKNLAQQNIAQQNIAQRNTARTAVARDENVQKSAQPEVLTASYQAPKQEEYITVRQEMFLVVTEQTASGEQQSWQMHVVEVSVQPLPKPAPKPRKI
jgi:hypothetical protein